MARFKSTTARRRQQQRLSRLKRQAKEFGVRLPDELSTRGLKTNSIKGIATAIKKDLDRFKRKTLEEEDVLWIFEQILNLFDLLKDINKFAYNELSKKVAGMSKIQIVRNYRELLLFADNYDLADDFLVSLDTRGEAKVQRFFDAEFRKLTS